MVCKYFCMQTWESLKEKLDKFVFYDSKQQTIIKILFTFSYIFCYLKAFQFKIFQTVAHYKHFLCQWTPGQFVQPKDLLWKAFYCSDTERFTIHPDSLIRVAVCCFHAQPVTDLLSAPVLHFQDVKQIGFDTMQILREIIFMQYNALEIDHDSCISSQYSF